jgi:hypothetical protein
MIPMNPVAEMLLTNPAPAAIWATLMLLCLPAVLLLGNPHSLRHPRLAMLDILGAARRRGRTRRQKSADAAETLRYAEEMRVAADQAVAAAARWQDHHDRAVTRSATTWQAWQDADTDLTRLRAAAAWGNPWTPATPAEYADRERYLHRTVQAAAERGDLPATAVTDALTGHGWDARLHPFDQDIAIARAIVTHRRELHRRAATAEATAAHDAHLAIRSRDSLRREFVTAAVHAAAVHHLAPTTHPAPRSGHRPIIARAA